MASTVNYDQYIPHSNIPVLENILGLIYLFLRLFSAISLLSYPTSILNECRHQPWTTFEGEGDHGARDTRSSITTTRESIALLFMFSPEGVLLPQRNTRFHHRLGGTRESDGPGRREDLRIQHFGQSALSRDFIHPLDFGSRREITNRRIPVNTKRALETFGISLKFSILQNQDARSTCEQVAYKATCVCSMPVYEECQ